MQKTIKRITFINRVILMIIVLLSLLGTTNGGLIIALLLGIPLGLFQVISSIIIIPYREKMTKLFKVSFNIYYLVLVIYFFLFNIMTNRQGFIKIEFSEIVLIIIPVVLAIGFTVILELLYKTIKS